MDEELGAGLGRVTRLAEVEARRLSQGYIGVEHLLLALLADDDSVAAQALASLDVSVELTRERVGMISAPAGSGTRPTGQLELTPRAERVLAMAQHHLDRAGEYDHHREHLLLAILDEGESVAVQVLKEQLGDDLGIAVERVMELAGEPQMDPEAVARRRPPRRIEQPEPLRCSFCGKMQSQVKRLIAGPGVYICNECVDLCVEILDSG